MEIHVCSVAVVVCVAVVLFGCVEAQFPAQINQIALENDVKPSTVVLVVLRDKCLCWDAQGIASPAYCSALFQNPLIEADPNVEFVVPDVQLIEFYDSYTQAVPAAERAQDLARVQSLLQSAQVNGFPVVLDQLLSLLDNKCATPL